MLESLHLRLKISHIWQSFSSVEASVVVGVSSTSATSQHGILETAARLHKLCLSIAEALTKHLTNKRLLQRQTRLAEAHQEAFIRSPKCQPPAQSPAFSLRGG